MLNLTRIPFFPTLAAAAAPVALMTAAGYMSPLAVATSAFALSFFSGIAALTGAAKIVRGFENQLGHPNVEIENQPGHPDGEFENQPGHPDLDVINLDIIKRQMIFAGNAFGFSLLSLASMYGLWKMEAPAEKKSFTFYIS